jgi:hypothetical protein
VSESESFTSRGLMTSSSYTPLLAEEKAPFLHVWKSGKNKNMSGSETKIDSAGEDQQQFTRQTDSYF